MGPRPMADQLLVRLKLTRAPLVVSSTFSLYIGKKIVLSTSPAWTIGPER